uniref:HD/PDEase domain-containing protein n=1 Tax=Panagrolaimus sp. PS1159 TaxID=55785 RepID=A0AC35G1W3_9BILA
MNEYSPLKLPKICNLICDTPIFSRLKRIKQLGSCSYVFPSATHTRFEHSIGTACLAFKFVKHLQFLSEDFKLSGNEMLDVILASLLRNLGHPAFSYLYEECFATPDLHQKMSVKLFDKMLVDSPKTNRGLRQHLTDRDFDLIRALIDPPPMFNINGEWNLPISPKKAYIFDIVNNLRNGLDVDKLDYIYRDGLRSGLNKYSINMNIIKRFIKSAFIGLDYSNRFHCLKFPESNANEIRLIFESKAELITVAFILAGPHLMFRTKAGRKISLEKCHEDLDAFIQLTDDSLYEKIMHPSSDHPDLIEASKILEAVEYREIPKLVAEIESIGKNDPSLNAKQLKSYLKSMSFDISQIITITKSIHVGKDFEENPMNSVLFYPRNDRTKSVLVYRKLESVKCSYIFAPYGSSIEDVKKIFEAISAYCKFVDSHSVLFVAL